MPPLFFHSRRGGQMALTSRLALTPWPGEDA